MTAGLFVLAVLTSGVAHAWHVSGSVWCDENGNRQIDVGDKPLAGVMVAVENASGSFSAVATTGADGRFRLELPHVPDSYLAYLHPPTVPPGATILLPAGGTYAFQLTHTRPSFEGAHFLLNCMPPTPEPEPSVDCGNITGGGWILTSSGAKASFGVSGGIRRGEFWGHLNYIDHGTGRHVRSTAVTGFQQDPANPNGRIIRFNVLIGTATGTATVRVVDNGEPGRNDTFHITLSTGYTAGGKLGGGKNGGGNIQLHKCPPGWKK